ncbi:hypothetical protein AB6D11_02670 [Vibrio splendidus]
MKLSNHTHVQHSVIQWQNGLVSFEIHAFIPCGIDGLSEEESADFLINHHGAEEPEDKSSWSHQYLPTSDDAQVNMHSEYHSHLAATVFKTSDVRLENLYELAPQMFKYC